MTERIHSIPHLFWASSFLGVKNSITLRGYDFKLYFPKPRSSESVANQLYGEIITPRYGDL